MSVTLSFSAELRAWIAENLDRGAPPSALIDALVRRDFERDVARGLITAFVHARAAGRPLPEHTVELDVEAPAYRCEPARIGAGNLIDTGDRRVRVLQRLKRPAAAMLERVFSDEECERLIELAAPRLARSTVVDPLTGTNAVASYRNSEGTFFRLREDPFISTLDERVSKLMNSPLENGEGLQVLRYGPGGHTAPHFDFLIPSNAVNSESIARSGQRIATLIVYLNDVEEGGETVFPEVGWSVTPRRGNGLYFEYTNSLMQVDPLSVHAGAPVTAGEKWVATKWMRTRKFVPAPS